MTNQKSLSLTSSFCEARKNNSISIIPKKDEYGQCYICHRINLPSLEITEKTRDSILSALIDNKKFIQIADHTVMVNAISSIDPMRVKRKMPDVVFDHESGVAREV